MPYRGETANYLIKVLKWRFGAFPDVNMKIQAPFDRVLPRNSLWGPSLDYVATARFEKMKKKHCGAGFLGSQNGDYFEIRLESRWTPEKRQKSEGIEKPRPSKLS